mgnify:CR=1 FL=1
MQTRRLFARIWRINAIVILLAGVIGTVVLSLVGYLLFRDGTRVRQVDNVANIALGEVRESAADLGVFSTIAGSSVLRAPLTVRQTYAIGSVSEEAGPTRNYLYLDPSSRAAHWLRPTMSGVILSSIPIPASEFGEQELKAVVFVHVTVDRDSNGDDRLTESDSKQIAVSAPDGTGYRVLVAEAEKLNAATLISPTRLLVVYSTGTKLSAVEADVDDLSSAVTRYDIPTALR